MEIIRKNTNKIHYMEKFLYKPNRIEKILLQTELFVRKIQTNRK